MITATLSYDDSVTPEMLDRVNKTTKEIFQYVAYSLNIGGYVPHVYEVGADQIVFVNRRMHGTRANLRWDIERKLVSLVNYFFRVKQNYWPVKIVEDVANGKFYTYIVIKTEPGSKLFNSATDEWNDAQLKRSAA